MEIIRFRTVMILAIAILCILFTTTQVFADMFGFSKKQEFVLSAPVEGQLLNDGKPFANEKVTRLLSYGKEYVDETVTNKDGYFSFQEKVIKTSKPENMFDNESLFQHIYIQDDNEEITIWAVRVVLHEKSNTLKKLLAELKCDIKHAPDTYDIPIEEAPNHTYAIYTPCKF